MMAVMFVILLTLVNMMGFLNLNTASPLIIIGENIRSIGKPLLYLRQTDNNHTITGLFANEYKIKNIRIQREKSQSFFTSPSMNRIPLKG